MNETTLDSIKVGDKLRHDFIHYDEYTVLGITLDEYNQRIGLLLRDKASIYHRLREELLASYKKVEPVNVVAGKTYKLANCRLIFVAAASMLADPRYYCYDLLSGSQDWTFLVPVDFIGAREADLSKC